MELTRRSRSANILSRCHPFAASSISMMSARDTASARSRAIYYFRLRNGQSVSRQALVTNMKLPRRFASYVAPTEMRFAFANDLVGSSRHLRPDPVARTSDAGPESEALTSETGREKRSSTGSPVTTTAISPGSAQAFKSDVPFGVPTPHSGTVAACDPELQVSAGLPPIGSGVGGSSASWSELSPQPATANARDTKTSPIDLVLIVIDIVSSFRSSRSRSSSHFRRIPCANTTADRFHWNGSRYRQSVRDFRVSDRRVHRCRRARRESRGWSASLDGASAAIRTRCRPRRFRWPSPRSSDCRQDR